MLFYGYPGYHHLTWASMGEFRIRKYRANQGLSDLNLFYCTYYLSRQLSFDFGLVARVRRGYSFRYFCQQSHVFACTRQTPQPWAFRQQRCQAPASQSSPSSVTITNVFSAFWSILDTIECHERSWTTSDKRLVPCQVENLFFLT